MLHILDFASSDDFQYSLFFLTSGCGVEAPVVASPDGTLSRNMPTCVGAPLLSLDSATCSAMQCTSRAQWGDADADAVLEVFKV